MMIGYSTVTSAEKIPKRVRGHAVFEYTVLFHFIHSFIVLVPLWNLQTRVVAHQEQLHSYLKIPNMSHEV